MGHRIFISYRRSSDSHFAGRLFDALASRFGDNSIFMDVDSIDIGFDFIAAMRDAVVSCDAVLVVIGKGWARVKDGSKQYRLHDPDDPVAFEVSTAIRLGKTIIPILVEQASMPTAISLPEPLRPLLRYNGQHIRHASFRTDVASLVAAIERLEPVRTSGGTVETVDDVTSTSTPAEEIPEEPYNPDAEKLHYHLQLRKALEALKSRSREARHEVYDQARRALVDFIESQTPPLPAEDSARRRLLLEDCIMEQEARFEDVQMAAPDLVPLDQMFAAELLENVRRRARQTLTK